jgi:hypothetical protein
MIYTSRTLRGLVVLNLMAFVAVIVMNTLANSLPINGMNTGEVSALYPNLFVPAGFTFSIWGLIYLALLLFVLKPIGEILRGDMSRLALIGRIGPLFFISCLANVFWIYAWHHQLIVISVVLMLVLLASLIGIYSRMNSPDAGTKEGINWLVYRFPFSLYLGWITVATVANITALLVSTGWEGGFLSPMMWSVLMIAVAGVMGFLFLIFRSDKTYALVIVWALGGIAFRHLTHETVNTFTGGAALVVGAMLLITTLYLMIRKLRT